MKQIDKILELLKACAKAGLHADIDPKELGANYDRQIDKQID